MAWFPYEKYTLNSKLASGQIRKKIESKIPDDIDIDPEAFTVLFVNERNTDCFEVDFLSDHFIVKEKVDVTFGGYRNSFRPEAIVEFRDNSTGTTNQIVIKPVLGVIIITCAMLCFVLIAGVTLLFTNKVRDGVLVLSIFPTFAYLLATFSFNVELGKIEYFINYLLEIEFSD
ncbi:MAG: hypothetical protein V4592_15620 [Bacteroidota bacterium]